MQFSQRKHHFSSEPTAVKTYCISSPGFRHHCTFLFRPSIHPVSFVGQPPWPTPEQVLENKDPHHNHQHSHQVNLIW